MPLGESRHATCSAKHYCSSSESIRLMPPFLPQGRWPETWRRWLDKKIRWFISIHRQVWKGQVCPYGSTFEIFEQKTRQILFLGTFPRKRIQFLNALGRFRSELTEIPYCICKGRDLMCIKWIKTKVNLYFCLVGDYTPNNILGSMTNYPHDSL